MLLIKYSLVLAWVGSTGLKEWIASVESNFESVRSCIQMQVF
jgi:hypothetical protein